MFERTDERTDGQCDCNIDPTHLPFSIFKMATTIPQKIKLRICHNAKCSYKPVVSGRFGRLPQSLDYNHTCILFSVQRKLLSSYDCVGLSNCRTKELSDHNYAPVYLT